MSIMGHIRSVIWRYRLLKGRIKYAILSSILIIGYFALKGIMFQTNSGSQPEISYGMKLSKDIKIYYRILNNIENLKSSLIVIYNAGDTAMSLDNTTLYFCNIRNVIPTSNEQLKLTHVNGCLYKIQAARRPLELKPGNKIQLYCTSKMSTSSRTDVMPNWFFVTQDNEVRVVENTAGEKLSFVSNFDSSDQWKAKPPFFEFDPLTPAERYSSIGFDSVDLKDKPLIVPQPLEVSGLDRSKQVLINKNWKLYADEELKREAEFLKAFFQITSRTPSKDRQANVVVLTIEDPEKKLSDKALGDESYLLKVYAEYRFIEIIGKTTAGVFYGIQTLISLASEKGTIPEVTIKDAPRFAFRGMHVDVARNFKPKSSILRLLDVMSIYKMNKFHFHLSDDEGWRLEIPGLPELTEIGARRCHDPSENKCILISLGFNPNKTGPLYYTVKDYQEILKYANDRHIQVIPEFDMPGHSHAAIKSMEARYRFYASKGERSKAEEFLLSESKDASTYSSVQHYNDNTINPCLYSSYRFIKHVISAVKDIHKQWQPLTVYHFGGDEVPRGVWEKSFSCIKFVGSGAVDMRDRLKKHFFERVGAITNSLGLSLGGWEDFFPEDKLMFQNVTAWSWNNLPDAGGGKKAYSLASLGYKIVLTHASHLYFDHPQEPDPEERGFFWATRFSDTRKVFEYIPNFCHAAKMCTSGTADRNIYGILGCTWSETIRTDDQMDFMIFPRMLALAERAWHKASWEDQKIADKSASMQKDWRLFATFVARHELQRLEKFGIKYRIPPPGIRLVGNKIKVRTALPGLPVLFSKDGGKFWNDVTDDTHTHAEGDREVIFVTSSLDRQRMSRQVKITGIL